ncbi:MAG TPA: S1C family serine protease [Alphaproteobacteria bacterium]|jgi:S1-C subfamily serine protease
MPPRLTNLPFDLDQTLPSVVAVRTTVPADASSAGRLGTERSGSGVIIANDGLVATVGYLLTEADSVWIIDDSGKAVPGHVVGQDQDSGFGLIQALEPLHRPPLAFGRSSELMPGDPLVLAAFGGIDQAVISRVIAKQEFAGYWEYLLDQGIFAAPAHPQWTGAAAIDRNGNLVGITSLIFQQFSHGGTNIDANLVIPIDLLRDILPDMKRIGRSDRPPRPWLGIWTAETEDKLVIAGMSDNGPAKASGLRVGDAILSVNGVKPRSLADMYRRIWALGPAGATVPFRVQRKDRELEISVQSADRARHLKRPRLN